MAATRRLAAVLAADLVGYSRLMGLDEEGTLVRLRALRANVLDPRIAENNGRLVKTTGDGFLVEFNSVIDALRCASDVQTAMVNHEAVAPDRRFMLRIGVHQGDIVVEDGDIFGNGVNIAARLEGIAEPGGICVSERVQEDAAGRIDLVFDDMGEQQLKNIARPIRAFHVRVQPPEIAPPEQPPPEAEPGASAEPVLSETEPAILPDAAETQEPSLFPFLDASPAHFGGSFEGEPHSAERLQARASEWLGQQVEILWSAEPWMPLRLEERTRLPGGSGLGRLNRLGIDATIGIRARGPQARIVLRIGPLDRASFEALRPGREALWRLVSLVRSFLGPETRFAINPVLAGAELTPLRLCEEANATPRLGWNTSIPAPRSPAAGVDLSDADEALFEADIVEAKGPAEHSVTNVAPAR